MTSPFTIAYFVSYHGFGHACRAAAVMAALERLVPEVRFELFTDCPAWLFKDTLANDFGHFQVKTDVGIVQRSPLEGDWRATGRELSAWLPFHPDQIDRLVSHLRDTQCRLVVCDISAMGIAAAKGAGLPCALVENFTWDYLYEPFINDVPDLEMPTYLLRNIYSQVDLHIQTEPICRPVPGSIKIGPISRQPKTDAHIIRRQLNIPTDAGMVLVSMGGVQDSFAFLDKLPHDLGLYLVIPGIDHTVSLSDKVILLPAHSSFFHPDLIRAADVIVAKAGYSTIAEAYHAGLPFGYIIRPDSPESPALERFLETHLPSRKITPEQYIRAEWIDMLPQLFEMERNQAQKENGADTVARLLRDTFQVSSNR